MILVRSGRLLLTGVSYGILQILIDPYILFPAQLVVDYLLAFGALGLAGLFAHVRDGLVKGYLAGILGRYFFSVLSGWIFFGTYAREGWGALPYSIVYNASYIFFGSFCHHLPAPASPVKQAMIRVKKTITE